MSVIPDEKISEIRERTSIVEVVGDYVSLRKAGSNYQGLCPFHGEKTPSFNVNPARGIFHCFGCGVGGDVLSFVIKMEGLSFPEAVKFLAKRVGVIIEERLPTAGEKRLQDEREALYRTNEVAAEFYRRVLTSEQLGEAGRRYLEQRGVDEATAAAYRLGFAPERWDAFTRHLEQKKIPLETAEILGLIRRKEGGGYYDTFRNRLLFAISDGQGRVIGFGGRVLDDSLPKYINSPESPIYRKSEVLFGINLAKPAMREQAAAIVVEGYFDHLALYQAGVRHAVATCGTAMTGEHLKLLQRYSGRLLTLFDSDTAGRKATCRTMELCSDAAFPTSVIELPGGDDPDTFLKREGAAAFAGCLGKARPIFDWFIRYSVDNANTGTVEGKVSVVEELTPFLRKITNPVERDLYTREVARVLGINERALAKKLGGSAVAAAEFTRRPEKKRSGTGSEDMLLALMGKYPEVAAKVAGYGVASLFSPDLTEVAEAVLAQVQSGQGVDWGSILDRVDCSEERSRLAALFVSEEHLEEINPLKMFHDLRKSREKQSLSIIGELKKELAGADPGSCRYRELLEQIDALRNRKSQLT